LVAEVDAICLDSWGFAAGVDTLVTGVGVGSVLVTAEVSGGELIVSEVVAERDRGMSVEVGIGLVMELDRVSGLISGLDSGDGAGFAGEVMDLVVGLDKGPWPSCVVETDVGVGLGWISGVV